MLDELGLKHTTRFVIYSGRQMVVMPWIEEFFRPWSEYASPILSSLPIDMQRHVGAVLSALTDLPQY